MMTIRTLLLTMLVLALVGVGCGDDDDGGSAGKGSSAGKGASAGKGDEAGGGSEAGSGGKTSGSSGSGGGSAKAGSGGAAGAKSTAGSGDSGGSGGAASSGNDSFKLTSSAVKAGEMLPAQYRCQGGISGQPGPSPALSWEGAPAGTKSFALLLRDRTFNNYQHWTIYDIPATVTSLPEGVPTGEMPAMPAGARQAANQNNFVGGPGYFGPCAGMGNYEFVVHAIDVAKLTVSNNMAATVRTQIMMHSKGMAALGIVSAPPNATAP